MSHTMAHKLLPIRILFHATFALVYLPIIVLATEVSFAQRQIGGVTTFAALAGLGIFAALDILTIRREVNQGAFLIVEITAVLLMPLPIWPIIISSISVVWPIWYSSWCPEVPCYVPGCTPVESGFCSAIRFIRLPEDEFTSASVLSATAAILALNTSFLLYVGISAVTDKIRGRKFLPIYPGDLAMSELGKGRKWCCWGNQRTPAERAVMVSHCADYIFRNSVFRKHAFEPTIWAIFRGIVAVYSCVGLLVFSAYAALSEAQLRETLTVTETISALTVDTMFELNSALSVVSFPVTSMDLLFPLNVNPEHNPPPTFPLDYWQHLAPEFWTTGSLTDFNISWTGEFSLVTWIITTSEYEQTGFFNSTQVKSTNPLVLPPFKQYAVSLIGINYILPDCRFTRWAPDIIASVDSESGANTSMAMFSFNNYQNQILTRDFSPPSMFSSVAHVLSDAGGTLSFIDGLFALVFGRTVVAIIFGTRIVSPFGLLGMVTHNRFKSLIYEQYPRMQEDIEQGGMAAYISEVAIDSALIDKPSAKGHTSSSDSSRVDDAEEAREDIELRRRQTAGSASSLRLSLVGQEFKDLETAPAKAAAPAPAPALAPAASSSSGPKEYTMEGVAKHNTKGPVRGKGRDGGVQHAVRPQGHPAVCDGLGHREREEVKT